MTKLWRNSFTSLLRTLSERERERERESSAQQRVKRRKNNHHCIVIYLFNNNCSFFACPPPPPTVSGKISKWKYNVTSYIEPLSSRKKEEDEEKQAKGFHAFLVVVCSERSVGANSKGGTRATSAARSSARERERNVWVGVHLFTSFLLVRER